MHFYSFVKHENRINLANNYFPENVRFSANFYKRNCVNVRFSSNISTKFVLKNRTFRQTNRKVSRKQKFSRNVCAEPKIFANFFVETLLQSTYRVFVSSVSVRYHTYIEHTVCLIRIRHDF